MVPHSGIPGTPLGPVFPHDQDTLGRDFQVVGIDALEHFLITVKHHGRPRVTEQLRGGSRTLEHGAVGNQVSCQRDQCAGKEKRGYIADESRHDHDNRPTRYSHPASCPNTVIQSNSKRSAISSSTAGNPPGSVEVVHEVFSRRLEVDDHRCSLRDLVEQRQWQINPSSTGDGN